MCRPGAGPHPVVITLSGSGGGLSEGGAALYASHGYAGFALAYFNYADLPQDLIEIPLEYFETAIGWLQRQPRLDGDRIAVSGTSRGGELVLLLGATFPAVKAVIAYVPSGIVHGGIGRSGVRGASPAWTFRGEAIPYMQPRPEKLSAEPPPPPKGEPIPLTPRFLRGLEDAEAAARAEIPVERINGPVLLISGKDDAMWPSTRHGRDRAAAPRSAPFPASVPAPRLRGCRAHDRYAVPADDRARLAPSLDWRNVRVRWDAARPMPRRARTRGEKS